MAYKSENKLEILLIRDFLIKETDAEHPASVHDIANMLSEHGITSDRRTIYSAIALLRDDYGLDIVTKGYKHFVSSRDFELEEIKLLVDMVQSSNFITLHKTEELIEKLKGQVSVHQGAALGRRIYVRQRIKSKNESVYINIDRISDAINRDKRISFRYFRYNIKKEKELRHGGKIHIVSPFALIWVDQNYYMLAYDSENREMRHYRVDRMTELSICREKRIGKDRFEKTDMSTYTNRVFYMFTGKETTVKLRCKSFTADAIIDRFGEDVMLIPDGEDYFTVAVCVAVSTQFFAWLSPFGKDIEILGPENVRRQMGEHMKSIAEMYISCK